VFRAIKREFKRMLCLREQTGQPKLARKKSLDKRTEPNATNVSASQTGRHHG
jgi:hypothetical protein